MAKGKKLILSDLRVESFVTELDEKKESKIKGGCAPTLIVSGCTIKLTYTGYDVCCV